MREPRFSSSLSLHPPPPTTTPPPATTASFSPLNPRAAPPPSQHSHQFFPRAVASSRSPPTSPSSATSLYRHLPNAFAHCLLSPSAHHRLPTSTSHNRRLLLSTEPSCRASSSSSAPPPIPSPRGSVWSQSPNFLQQCRIPCCHLPNAFAQRLLSPSSYCRLPTSTSRNHCLLLSPNPRAEPPPPRRHHQFYLPSALQSVARHSATMAGGSEKRARR